MILDHTSASTRQGSLNGQSWAVRVPMFGYNTITAKEGTLE